jgi:hypothetical protein
MKIGQRDVVIGFGKNKPWPRKYWVLFTPRGREWISPGVIGGGRPGFWLTDVVPRRFEAYGPTWSFTIALNKDSRCSTMDHSACVDGHRGTCVFGKPRWIELERDRLRGTGAERTQPKQRRGRSDTQ